MRFLHELLLFFINSFFIFPSHIKRIIFFFVYLNENQPYFIYPSLLEENFQPSCVVEVGPEPSLQPIENIKVYISITHEHAQPCDHENDEIDSKPSHILLPYAITLDPCHQLVKPCFKPKQFQYRVRQRVFKPLKFLSHLHPYPPNFFEYLPRFTGEDHVLAEKHLGTFANFVDNMEIIHEDVVMTLFSKSLTGEAALWFRDMEPGSIVSWIDFYYVFSKYWDENKSLDQFLADVYTLRRGEGEFFPIFNRRFYNIYHSMPIEI
jgi:hypothetical protein